MCPVGGICFISHGLTPGFIRKLQIRAEEIVGSDRDKAW